jgi:hypothetical protein
VCLIDDLGDFSIVTACLFTLVISEITCLHFSPCVRHPRKIKPGKLHFRPYIFISIFFPSLLNKNISI